MTGGYDQAPPCGQCLPVPIKRLRFSESALFLNEPCASGLARGSEKDTFIYVAGWPQGLIALFTKGVLMEWSFGLKGAARLGTILALMLAVGACSQSPKPEDAGLTGGYGRGAPATPGSARDFSQNVGDIVYFSTDQVELSPEAQQTLGNQARWLQKYAQYTITIEGHADERGTREYNIGLGSKRAEAVKVYLSRNGINASRIRTISYGKERPVAVCNDISCWSQNRRAQTVLNSRGAGS
jgi:peptidoglycan-associated lipoprotein